MKYLLSVLIIFTVLVGFGGNAYATREQASQASTDAPVSCFSCHSEDGAAGPVPAPPDHTPLMDASCNSCHANMPMPEKSNPFPDGAPTNHMGVDVNAACGTCHGSGRPFPPTDQGGAPTQDHSGFTANNPNSCVGCHGESGMIEGASGWILVAPVVDVDADGDGYPEDEDCDDNDASIYPGADEIPYDGIDQDCDGSDFDDVDQDGFSWKDIDGNVVDCDDENPAINPDAEEILDNDVDENCDGIIAVTEPVDNDGDGYSDDDCNDGDPAIHPGADEIPYDGIDQDCDGSDLDDVDQDGFPWKDVDGNVVDCDDQDASINPDATEIMDNDVDENCDGIAETTPPSVDADNDGFSADVDCNDNDPSINPDAEEIPGNDVDENCDGIIEGAPPVQSVDNDGDGYVNVDENGNVVDCNDDDALIHPGATEICDDGVDNDCDGLVDAADADDCTEDPTEPGGCNGPTHCDPCAWAQPCEPVEPPAELNIDVDIEIISGASPDIIKIGAKGPVMVVIKGSKELDVKTIDTGSILLADVKPVKFYFDDLSCKSFKKRFFKKDKDMVVVFRRCDLSLDADATQITLTGKTLSGVKFTGTDTIKVIDCSQ